MNTRYCLLSSIVLCGIALPAEAQAKGPCRDIPLRVAIAPISQPSLTGGLYGDGLTDDGSDPAVASVYTDGKNGLYAKFQICDGSNRFTLALAHSGRFYTTDFSLQLVPGDTGSPGYIGPTGPLSGGSLQIAQVANLSLYSVAGQLDTSMSATVQNLPSASINYCNKSLGLVCTGGRQQVANKWSDTSVVRVTVAANCASWTITPLVPSPGDSWVNSSAVAGLVEGITSKGTATLISGGQYSMPFSISLTRLDGRGCADLR